MDEPKFGTTFIARPKNNSTDIFICTVLGCMDLKTNDTMVNLNFENVRTGTNRGNGTVSLETYHENVKNGLFRIVDEETIKVLKILFYCPVS